MKKVYIDSNIFIYAYNQSPEFGPASIKLLESIDSGEVLGVTSVLTLTETLCVTDSSSFELMMNSVKGLSIVNILGDTARTAARLIKENPKLKTPDALHLATAIVYKVDEFVTNDRDFAKVIAKYLVVRSVPRV
jgi:predicted nucleic acid-binding protein